MILMSLDLEMNQPSGTIISIGTCIGNINTGEIIETKEWIIFTNETINDRIVKLTGITQDQVNQGVQLSKAYEELKDMHAKHKCFINPLTWGGGDSETLKQQLNINCSDWCFGRRWIDLKTVVVLLKMSKGLKVQSGLGNTMIKFGLNFDGRKHNAKDDAYNTFRLAHLLCDKLKSLEVL